MKRAALLMVVALSLGACSDPPADDGNANNGNNGDGDTGTDTGTDAPDTPEPDVRPDVPDVEPDGGNNGNNGNNGNPGALCSPCDVNEQCGGANDLCLQLPFEDGRTCGQDCTLSAEICPDNYDCVLVQETPLEIRNCIPISRVCDDPCVGIECDPGQTCSPATGQCADPLALCDQNCVLDEQCGGPDDRCVGLNTTGENICAQVCVIDEETGFSDCPEDYFCARINALDGEFFQCVPDLLTCLDRCGEASCAQGEVCDPLTGLCTARLGQCDLNCDNNGICGATSDDICLAIPGNGGNESFCALACDDAFDCPIDHFCAMINGRTRGSCVPVELTCVDRCANVDCPDGSNCDIRTGACVRSELGLCDACGDLDSVSCGAQRDLCINVGEPAGVICSQDCSDTGQCPNDGYTCVILQNSTRRVCIPIGGDCLRCNGINCPGEDTCNPLTGECVPPPQDCNDAGCERGFICNPDSGDCELIGEACTFETRFDCFGPVRKCSASRARAAGVCAVICNGDDDCPAGAPHCTDLYRVGELCVPDGLGGPTTCGNTAPEGVGIGRPCGANVVAPCPVDAPTCVQGVEPNIPGFCSLGCATDADCGGDGTCQELRGRPGRFCTPPNCLCLAGNAVPDGTNDILQEALDVHGLDRCSLSLDPYNQGFLDPAIPSAPLKPAHVGSLAAQPLSSLAFGQALGDELAQAGAGNFPTRDAIIAAAARAGYPLEARAPSFAIPDELEPLAEGLRAFTEAAGGQFRPNDVVGDIGAVPTDLQDKLAQILFAAAEVVTARQGVVEAAGLSPTEVSALFDGAPYLFLPPAAGATPPDLDDPEIVARLDELDLGPLFQATADLAATIELAQLAPSVDYDSVNVSVDTPAGAIILGAAGDTDWDGDAPLALVLDVSGNDTWTAAAGATRTSTQPVGLTIDLDGDDVYGYVVTPSPRDTEAWLPSDAGGRFDPQVPVQAGHGPVSLSDTGRQGSGRLGAGLLYDLGAGTDRYTSLRMSQGAGVMGAGVLYDGGGDDNYAVEAFGQGAGLLGIGVVIDAGPGADNFRIWHAGQGFGTTRGVGVAYDGTGATQWRAEPATGIADVLYFSFPDRGQSNQNFAQGCGAGLFSADQRFPDRQAMGGGLGILWDGGGDDVYTAGTYAMGAGVHLGTGILVDIDGTDTYDARYGAVGFGDTVSVGAFLEYAGADTYLAGGRVIGSMLGHGRELGAGVFADFGGDDSYRVASASAGVGNSNGGGIFLDLGGSDEHVALSTNTWGYAAGQLQDDDPRASLPTYGVFIDAGPQADTYTRIDLEDPAPPLIGDGLTWTQRADADSRFELGVGIDGEGLTGYEP